MRLIRDVRTHIRRSPYQAMAAVLTMFLTFLVGSVFFLATVASLTIISYFESKPQLTVFFVQNAGEKEATLLKETLDQTGKVASTKFISKDEALATYKEQNKNDPLLLEMVTADILPASLEVSAKDPTFLSELDTVIVGATGVDEVIYQRDVVDSLLSWTNAIRLIGGILGGLLVLDSLLIIGTVIAMKIALKREEIEILTLVGATSWTIRAPFILEGGLYGVMGAGVASFLVTILILWQRYNIVTFLGVIPSIQSVLGSSTSVVFILSCLGFIVVNMIVGFIIGSLGSVIALARYLRD
ncbi:MAG: permease-like cell division protein FtsX [Patescibacteria group bacterium]